MPQFHVMRATPDVRAQPQARTANVQQSL
jgi:hypothetical protein